jgi:hypothetical protein
MAIKKALVIYGGSIEELHSGDSLGASGDVTGPSASTDNAIARFDGTTGKLIQDSTVSVDDNGNIQNANSLGFDVTPATIPTAVGAVYWDEGNKTPSINLDNDVSLQLGQEIVTLCYNGSGSTIANGSVVAVTGAQGQRPRIVLADADSESTSARTLGIATQDIANGAEGFITSFGFVRGINTSGFTAGSAVYLSQTAGQFTATKPSAPAHLVHLGYVIKINASSGEIFVTINNGWEFDELHDVLITDLQNGQIAVRDQVLGVWKNITINGTTGEVTVTSTKDGITISLPDTVSANITGNAGTVTNGVYTTDIGVSVQAYDADLSAIAGLAGTSGFLKKTALNTWTLDTSTYLTAETDPIFSASPASGITSTNISNWNTAYGWGNHATAGYLTTSVAASTYQPLDADIPTVSASQAEMEAGTQSALRSMSPLRIAQAIAALAGGGFSNMDIITASTTWSVPAGVTKAKITVIGGGGGGSGNKTPSVDCGAFGGNGGVAIALVTGLSGSYTVTIGAGGAGGAGGTGTSTGGNGGNTSFGSILSATGGTGANGVTAGTSGTGTVSSGTAIRSGAKANPLPYEVAGTGQDRDNATAIAYSKTAEYGAGVGGDAGGLISATAYAGGGGIGGVVIIEY